MQRWLELAAAWLNGAWVCMAAFWVLTPELPVVTVFRMVNIVLFALLTIQIGVSLGWRWHQRRLRAENAYLRERGHCPDWEAALAEHATPAPPHTVVYEPVGDDEP